MDEQVTAIYGLTAAWRFLTAHGYLMHRLSPGQFSGGRTG